MSQDYFKVSRETIEDKNLKNEELGFLLCILAQEDDYKVNVINLSETLKISKSKVRRLIKRLIEKGYAKAEWSRDGGQYEHLNYIVYEGCQWV